MDFWHRLPDHFRRDVVDRLDFKSRCRLRKTCLSDKILVDSCPVFLKSVAIALTSKAQIQITCWNRPNTFFSHSTDQESFVINDFLRMLKNGKSEIDRLEIVCYVEENTRKMTGALEQLCIGLDRISSTSKNREFPLKSKAFHWHCYSECYPEQAFQKILNSFDPKFFQSITVNDDVLFEKCRELPEKVKCCRKICIHAPIIFTDSLKSADKLLVNLTLFKVENVVVMIESFLDRNPPLGSFFDLSSYMSVKVSEILQKLNVLPKNEPFQDRLNRAHTQRFEMKNKNNVLVVVMFTNLGNNSTTRVTGIVCRKECVKEDFRKSWD